MQIVYKFDYRNLESNVEIQQSHSEVVRYENATYWKRFSFGHKSTAVINRSEINHGNEQGRNWWLHHGPFSNPRIYSKHKYLEWISVSKELLWCWKFYLPGSYTTSRTVQFFDKHQQNGKRIRNKFDWLTSPCFFGSNFSHKVGELRYSGTGMDENVGRFEPRRSIKAAVAAAVHGGWIDDQLKTWGETLQQERGGFDAVAVDK